MRIVEYKYSDGPAGGWDYSKIKLGKINLFVGESGSGKTKLLNTIFNISQLASPNNKTNYRGAWEIVFKVGATQYSWLYENSTGEGIDKEIITRSEGGNTQTLVSRKKGEFLFNDKALPKLSSQISAISLLAEEADIQPIFESINKVIRRNFFGDALERTTTLGNIPAGLLSELGKSKDMRKVKDDLPLSVRLYLLSKVFPEKYNQICDNFKTVFSSVESCDLPDATTVYPEMNLAISGKIPVFAVREKGVEGYIGINELSSGMQKVLLLLTDIISLAGDHIYLLDEYENSLGVNAINFFPDFLSQFGGNNQFIITTHHPYLINNMPIKDWYVFHRSGSDVTIKHGEELEEKFGKSKQKAFVQLMNDPFFTEGK